MFDDDGDVALQEENSQSLDSHLIFKKRIVMVIDEKLEDVAISN